MQVERTGRTKIKGAKLKVPEKTVGVPTMKGMGDSFKDFGLGAVGGLAFILAYQIFGVLGIIAAPLIAGSVIKGDRGQIIATMAGFMLFALAGTAGGGGGGSNNEVM